MRLRFLIKGINCAGRGGNLWHCAGVDLLRERGGGDEVDKAGR